MPKHIQKYITKRKQERIGCFHKNKIRTISILNGQKNELLWLGLKVTGSYNKKVCLACDINFLSFMGWQPRHCFFFYIAGRHKNKSNPVHGTV